MGRGRGQKLFMEPWQQLTSAGPGWIRKGSDLCTGLGSGSRRVCEKSGPKLAQLLVRTNPHQEEVCQREGCMVCETRGEEDRGKARCWQEGVTYSLTCQSCPEGSQAMYIGQTASTAFTRGKEHANQYRLSKEGKRAGASSVMARHAREAYQGDLDTEFKMDVLSCHLNQAHVRQCAEGVRIKEVPGELLINNKSEGG